MSDTVRLGLVGSQIGRSLAPRFHVEAARKVGIELTYDLFEHLPQELSSLASIVADLRRSGLAGINVTYPFKTAALGLTDETATGIETLGAVNTLIFRGATTCGFNTDYSGLIWRWMQLGAGSPGVVAVLGAGGVGRAAAFAFARLGADEIRIHDIDGERATGLVAALGEAYPGLTVGEGGAVDAVVGASGVFNATPVGMHFMPGSPIDLRLITDQAWVFDAIYAPFETPLLCRGVEVGMRTFNGFDLFIGQGVDAFRHFTDIELPADVVTAVERDLRLELLRTC